MKIDRKLAQSIIDELSHVLQQQLNFFDEGGVILASTTPERIGQSHEGAAKLIREHLSELIVYSDSEYIGARRGCNFPLVIDGITVGAIGITGESNEVRKYGQIIKKMTELQIRESDVQERKKIADRIRDRFFDDWLLISQNESDPMFVQRARALQIDLTLPRRVAVLRIEQLNRYSDNPKGQCLIDDINRALRAYVAGVVGCLFSKTASLMILLIPSTEDAQLRAFIRHVLDMICERFGVRLIAGVDCLGDVGKVNVHQAYLKAIDALNACEYAPERQIFFYDETTYELFLGELSERTKSLFIARVFHGLSEDEIAEYAEILTTLYRMNGSITRTAEAHFVHKNTLQYKLNKLYERTGLNPRACQSIPLFYLAILFYKNRMWTAVSQTDGNGVH